MFVTRNTGRDLKREREREILREIERERESHRKVSEKLLVNRHTKKLSEVQIEERTVNTNNRTASSECTVKETKERNGSEGEHTWVRRDKDDGDKVMRRLKRGKNCNESNWDRE